uniref:Uncharacterized protein n=1 Tax=Ditylenchus dipsaci TaxID=166011 RepID=A0A915D589_9BILA
MTSNGTTYFLTSATTTSAQQNSYMEDFNDAEHQFLYVYFHQFKTMRLFLDEDQQAQPVGTPTGDDFSALFNVPIDDTFFGEATSGLDVQNLPPTRKLTSSLKALRWWSSLVRRLTSLMAQRLALQAIANPHSNKCKISNLRPCSHMIPCQPAAPQGQYNPSGQQLQQPYTSSTNLNHTSSTNSTYQRRRAGSRF